MNDLITYFLVALGINLLMFLPAFLLKTDKLTDISYAVTFVTLAILGLFNNQTSLTVWILFSMVLIWAIRIGSFLLLRVTKVGKDSRFDDMRENFFKFLMFWILQGFTVFMVMLPSVLFFRGPSSSLTWMSYVGIALWLAGLIIETVADYQKLKFKADPANESKWIATGLWKYSRHPNYLGEIMIWLGVYLFCVTDFSLNRKLIALIGPAYISLLLMFVSGVPILEKYADKRWGKDQAYQDYKKKTGILLPKF